MRRKRRRPMYYHAQSLNDGTVIAAYPIRKPGPKVIKRDGLKIDEDGVCTESLSARRNSLSYDEGRFRFQDIISTSLNTRRAIREVILPVLTGMQQDVAALRAQLVRIEKLLAEHVR